MEGMEPQSWKDWLGLICFVCPSCEAALCHSWRRRPGRRSGYHRGLAVAESSPAFGTVHPLPLALHSSYMQVTPLRPRRVPAVQH